MNSFAAASICLPFSANGPASGADNPILMTCALAPPDASATQTLPTKTPAKTGNRLVSTSGKTWSTVKNFSYRRMAGVQPQRYDVRSRKQSEYFAMKLPPFEYSCPDKLADAVALLAAHGSEAKALAGGQSLVPMLAFRVASPSLIVDLRKLDELRRIDISEAGITLGAMVRWREILENAELGVAHPLLAAAIGHVAHYQIRNRRTGGGSLAHADPA